MLAGRFRRAVRRSGSPREEAALNCAGEAPERSTCRAARNSATRRFLRLHAPQAIFASRSNTQQARGLAVSLQLLTDLFRDQIGFGDKYSKWLARLLPTIEPPNSPFIGHRNHQLDRRMHEATLIRSPHDLGNGATRLAPSRPISPGAAVETFAETPTAASPAESAKPSPSPCPGTCGSTHPRQSRRVEPVPLPPPTCSR